MKLLSFEDYETLAETYGDAYTNTEILTKHLEEELIYSKNEGTMYKFNGDRYEEVKHDQKSQAVASLIMELTSKSYKELYENEEKKNTQIELTLEEIKSSPHYNKSVKISKNNEKIKNNNKRIRDIEVELEKLNKPMQEDNNSNEKLLKSIENERNKVITAYENEKKKLLNENDRLDSKNIELEINRQKQHNQYLTNLKIKKTDKEEKQLTKNDKKRKTITSTSFINQYSNLVCHEIINRGKITNNYKHEIHFKNGYIDIENNEFVEASIKDRQDKYILEFNDWDYKESDKKTRDEVMKVFNQIITNKKDLQLILREISTSMVSKKTQRMLNLIGEGSNAKTTLIKIIGNALGIYYKEAQSCLLSRNSKEASKEMAGMSGKKYFLLYADELQTKAIDTERFKRILNQETVEVTKMYTDGIFKVDCSFKLVVTSNNVLNFGENIDKGIIRRLLSYTCDSEFTTDKTRVDNKRVFLKDYGITEKFNTTKYKNAILDILVETAHSIKDCNNFDDLTQKFYTSTAEIINLNDELQGFINSYLNVTNDPKDKICKTRMMELYNEYTGKEYKFDNSFLKRFYQRFREKKIEYNEKLRFKYTKIRGGFIGVKEKSDEEVEQELKQQEEDEKFNTNVFELKSSKESKGGEINLNYDEEYNKNEKKTYNKLPKKRIDEVVQKTYEIFCKG